MSGENHVGNKSPDICNGNDQRRFLGTKHKNLLLKGAKREGHRNVQRQISLLLVGFHGLRSTCYSLWRPAVDGLLLSAWIVDPMARCHNLAAPETLSDKAVAGSNVQRKGGHRNVHGLIE